MKTTTIRSLRLCAITLAAASLLGSAAAGTLPKAKYLVTDLGTAPSLSTTNANAINSAGQVTGSGRAGPTEQAFVGTAGMLQAVPRAGAWSVGNSINYAGQVAGYANVPDTGTSHAFLYGNGVTMDLGTLGGPSSNATGINDKGLVVGISDDIVGHLLAFRWSGGVMRALPALTSDSAMAFAVNNRRTIVGQSLAADGVFDAVIWRKNQITDIDPGRSISLSSAAVAVNDSDVVAGYLVRADGGGMAAFTWNAGTSTVLPSPFGSDHSATAINKSGAVVGYAFGVPSSVNSHAVIWQKGEATDLNLLLDPVSGAGVELMYASAINDNGQIVARGTYQGEDGHSFLLTPR